jgi:hypothetical protein
LGERLQDQDSLAGFEPSFDEVASRTVTTPGSRIMA